MTKVEELEKKLQDQRDARASREAEQYAKDLEQRIELEAEHGQLTAVKVSRFVDGQPTFALVRTPTSSEYKRFKDLVARAKREPKSESRRTLEAIDMLATSCWVYPVAAKTEGKQDAQSDMLEAFPGILTSIANVAASLAEGRAEDEGKG